MTSTVKQNVENAQQANELAVFASSVAIKSGAVLSEVMHTMRSINVLAKKLPMSSSSSAALHFN